MWLCGGSWACSGPYVTSLTGPCICRCAGHAWVMRFWWSGARLGALPFDTIGLLKSVSTGQGPARQRSGVPAIAQASRDQLEVLHAVFSGGRQLQPGLQGVFGVGPPSCTTSLDLQAISQTGLDVVAILIDLMM